jgi:hypothetical protein
MSKKLKARAEKIAKLAGKAVGATKKFKAAGTFEAYRAAEEHAKSLGYTTGSMCRAEPIALSKSHDYIAKWRNIDPSEYPDIEGLLLSESFRESEVLFVEFK